MKILKKCAMLVSFVLITLASNIGLAKGSELTFTSIVTAVSQTDSTAGIIDVSIRGLDVPIIVNRDTEIELGGDEEGLATISVGDFVKIRAFLSDQGVIAEEIEIVDPRYQYFRFKGVITSVSTIGESTQFIVMGVTVTIDPSAIITSSNSVADNSINPADLESGNEASVTGRLQNGELVATRIHVGSREQGEIEFEGILTAVTSDSITVAIEGGVTTVAVLDENSEVRGDLIPGNFVEVEGRFNDELSIIVREVAVDKDGDDDADDDNNNSSDDDSSDDSSNNSDDDSDNVDSDDDGVEIGSEILLSASGTAINGKAEVRFRDRGIVDQKFEVEIEDAPVGITYSILVYFGDQSVDFGSFTTNEFGEAEAEFEIDDEISDRPLAPLLPSDTTVLDISSVQILQSGSVVIEGSF